MAQFGTRMMDRQRLELGRNAYAAFVTIPGMMPSLAWRYLTNRRSFFAATDEHGKIAAEHGKIATEEHRRTQMGDPQATSGRR
jgi:hypothetical protein